MSDFLNRRNDSGLGLNLMMGATIVVSAILIFAAACSDLWLDEIWSVFIAESAKSPWDIISLYKHDNNHLLNTLYLYFVGKLDHFLSYRLLSIIAGIGSLFLLARIACSWGRFEGVLVLFLAGFSYPLILYFSEARGYAPAIFFSCLSLLLLEESSTDWGPIKLPLFWLSTCLGILSHPSFSIVFLSLSLLVAYAAFSSASPLKSKLLHPFKYLFVPSLFIVLFYLYFARNMTIGGGDNNRSLEMAKGIAYLLGLPDIFIHWKVVVFAIFTAIALFGIFRVYQDRDKSWIFFPAVLLSSPALIIFVTQPQVYYFRYLVITYPFFYLMVSLVLSKIYLRGGKYPYLVILVICLYLVGQAQYVLPLMSHGRGGYQAILSEISARTHGNVLNVGSDHDFRNKMLLTFYQRSIPPDRKLNYIEQKDWNQESPEWMILHSMEVSPKPEPFIRTWNQQIYELTKVERSSGESGFSWFLYHSVKHK